MPSLCTLVPRSGSGASLRELRRVFAHLSLLRAGAYLIF